MPMLDMVIMTAPAHTRARITSLKHAWRKQLFFSISPSEFSSKIGFNALYAVGFISA
jgi:hypothetical protein